MNEMSRWANYARERFGWSAIEDDRGTLLYSIRPPLACIEELYIPEDRRKSGAASLLVGLLADIGKAQGCTHLWAQVVTGAINANEALLAALHYGFSLAASDEKRIILTKEI